MRKILDTTHTGKATVARIGLIGPDEVGLVVAVGPLEIVANGRVAHYKAGPATRGVAEAVVQVRSLPTNTHCIHQRYAHRSAVLQDAVLVERVQITLPARNLLVGPARNLERRSDLVAINSAISRVLQPRVINALPLRAS